MSSYSNPKAISNYAENATRRVPGLHDLHRMADLLLAERTPADGRLLIVGAGGGMEIQHFAQSHPTWQFDGIDPSAEMLALAKTALAPYADRVQLHQGYVEAAPTGPFDAATCFLTLHFLPAAERLRTLREILTRLKPGGVFVAMHFSMSANRSERQLCLSRCAAFATLSGLDAELATTSTTLIGKQLPILSPEQDEALMRQAGFTGISNFYAALGFRGWVAYR